jgi:predicted TPR repeat methyltransferase
LSFEVLLLLTFVCADIQHQMLMGLMGKYPPCMEEVLEDNFPGDQKQILDLGCGSGAWYVRSCFPFASSLFLP